MTAELVYSLQPDIARAFLRRHISDASVEELAAEVSAAIHCCEPSTADDFHRALVALESTLDRSLEPGTLLGMVEFDANTGLADPTDEGARAWLEDLTARVRAALGAAAPPRRGTHRLDRER